MDIPTANQCDTDFLGIDAHTQFELEIFESKSGASLFEFCNLTQTKGGELALRRRMQRPWATAARIRETQASITYIMENRQLFDKFNPGNLGFVTGSIDTYMHAPLPIIDRQNVFEFTYTAIWLYASDPYPVAKIARAVVLMRKLIGSLRDFLGQPTLVSAEGELAPLLAEARAILFNGPLSEIRQEQPGMGVGKILRALRLDQLFRIVEPDKVSRLLSLVYEIDTLIALADCTKQHNFILPTVAKGDMQIYAEGLVHPYVQDAVANPVELDQLRRGLFLTGPNMAGKTRYLRAFATALYFAHLGMGVPASRYRFVPVQQLISSISLSDNLHSGVSYFRAEALRVKDVANAIMSGYRVVAIMDEPFKGTNVKDTLEASLGILTRFSTMPNLLFMFSSHQIELAEQLGGPIDKRYFEAIETEERLRFDYCLREGVATQRIGMRVLREEGVFEVLDN
jgi:DNA mismatch repair ATPase MutS